MVRNRQGGNSSSGEYYSRKKNKKAAGTKKKTEAPPPPQNNSNNLRYLNLVFLMLFVYISPLVLFYTIPALQAQIVFMPKVSWPPFLNLSDPSSVGLAATRNFYITSENSIQLGVWHILPKSFRNKNIVREEDFIKALDKRPVILYAHGNAGTRGGYHRVELCKLLADLDFNVIAYDYRGFGDSTDERPTATGLVEDSKVVYRWIKSKLSNNHKLFVWGHSMGTAVVSRFVSELAAEGIKPTGVVLESGFNSVKSGIFNYPLARLYNYLPFFEHILDHVINTQNLDFISEERVKKVRSPLLMLHAADDKTVKINLGRSLRDAAQSSRPNNLYFKYIEFEADHGYGHKYIFTDPSLPDIIRDFAKKASKSQ